MSSPPLPDVQRSLLDERTLAELGQQLVGASRVIGVRLKGAPTTYTPPGAGPISVPEALDLLRQRSVRGVQIDYVFEGVEWCDTLIRRADGYQLVRMAAPVAGDE